MSTVDLQCSFTLVEGEGRGEVVVWELSSLQLCTGPGLLGLSLSTCGSLLLQTTDLCLIFQLMFVL